MVDYKPESWDLVKGALHRLDSSPYFIYSEKFIDLPEVRAAIEDAETDVQPVTVWGFEVSSHRKILILQHADPRRKLSN